MDIYLSLCLSAFLFVSPARIIMRVLHEADEDIEKQLRMRMCVCECACVFLFSFSWFYYFYFLRFICWNCFFPFSQKRESQEEIWRIVIGAVVFSLLLLLLVARSCYCIVFSPLPTLCLSLHLPLTISLSMLLPFSPSCFFLCLFCGKFNQRCC